VSSTKAPPAPLEALDEERAQVLKQKIFHRLADVGRHHGALRAGMAEFGEDFDLDVFAEAYTSTDPSELNRVKALERGVDQLHNYVAELASFGLQLSTHRSQGDDLNARLDLEALGETGVLSRALVKRLQRLRVLRRDLVHEYPTATAEQVHEAVQLAADHFPTFREAYLKWLSSGFALPEPMSPAG